MKKDINALNSEAEMFTKYRRIIQETHMMVFQANIKENEEEKVNNIIYALINNLLYEEANWNEVECLTFLGTRILFEHPFMDGNKRTGLKLILDAADADPDKTNTIMQFLWDK